MNERDVVTRGIHTDCLLNHEIVKYFGGEECEAQRYTEVIGEHRSLQRRVVRECFHLIPLQNHVNVNAYHTRSISQPPSRITRGQSSTSDFVVFITYYVQLYFPLSNLGDVYRAINQSLVDTEKLLHLYTSSIEAAIDMGRRKCNSSGDERPTVEELRATMDKRPVEASAPTNDPAQATQKMDMQLARCRLGVAYIDIVKIQNPLLFGKYNNRPQVEREVNKLIASFKKEGILAMREDTAIPIMLSSTRLKSGLRLALNFNEEEVPQLQLKDAHDIVVASGQLLMTPKKYALAGGQLGINKVYFDELQSLHDIYKPYVSPKIMSITNDILPPLGPIIVVAFTITA
ncbi:hypothetical protein EDB19DRAFT_1978076 [Suillus lakei]|nr:hypothetical protein EDB19DRAFT_1978076 [Suillus lakei]